MAIKSYTDLEQSKKLAEILPIESADMIYRILPGVKDNMPNQYIAVVPDIPAFASDIPCWSLAALLSVLPMITKGKDTANPFIAKTPDNEYYVVYATTKEIDNSGIYDNPIDACYEMILKLNELKML